MSIDNKEQTKKLFEEYYKTKDTELRNRIVEKYLYLVDVLVSKYRNRGLEYDDLYQAGSLALVLAVERFDPTKGFEFASFATPTIIGEIKRYFRDKGWAVKVPRQLKDIAAKIPETTDYLYVQLRRKPTAAEIAEHLGYSVEKILEAMESGQHFNTYSLNYELENEPEEAETSILEKFTGFEEQGFSNVENSSMMKSILKNLSEREKKVLQMRIAGETTQSGIAEALGVSQMTVSRIEDDIRSKFRKEFYG